MTRSSSDLITRSSADWGMRRHARRKRGGKYAVRILVAVLFTLHMMITGYVWTELHSLQRRYAVLEQQTMADAAILYALSDLVLTHKGE